ncbi:hypothetical protein [Carnimonas bestiolae]|uniref:hypothetical protein n=1 Tax=Carnimonas bestiolae TaxID=3402172 RepID=UPI003EDC7548
MDRLEKRVDTLELTIQDLSADVAAIKSSHATKHDLVSVYQAINSQTWKLITAMGMLVATFSAINGVMVYFLK